MNLKRRRTPLLGVLPHINDGETTCFHLSADRRLVVLGSTDGTLILYNATRLSPTSDAKNVTTAHQLLNDADSMIT